MRKHTKNEQIRKQCLLEMLCRATGNYIKQNLRDQAEDEGMFRQESFIINTCIFYNKMIEINGEIWKSAKLMKRIVLEKFGEDCLTEKEKRGDYNLRKQVMIGDLFKALEERTGISLKESVLERFRRVERKQKSIICPEEGEWEDWVDDDELEEENFELMIDDFKPIKSSVKGLKLSTFAMGEDARKRANKGNKTANQKLRLFFKAARMMEEGSKGDIEGLVKQLEVRLEITGFIIGNLELLKSEESRVQKHLDKVEKIFEEVEELCEFNEVTLPSSLEYLRIESKLQEFFLSRRKKAEKGKVDLLTKLFERVEKLDESVFPGKKNQLKQIGNIYYEVLEKSGWEENWREHAENFMGWGPMLSNEIVAEGGAAFTMYKINLPTAPV